MDDSPEKRPPLAVAIEWVSKLTTVALMMVLPGVGGAWLDRRWGTQYIALAGFAIGLVSGMWYLLRLVQVVKTSKPREQHPKDSQQ